MNRGVTLIYSRKWHKIFSVVLPSRLLNYYNGADYDMSRPNNDQVFKVIQNNRPNCFLKSVGYAACVHALVQKVA